MTSGLVRHEITVRYPCFLWWATEPEKLSPLAAALCADERNSLHISVASIWEMQIKADLGKLSLFCPLDQLINIGSTTAVEVVRCRTGSLENCLGGTLVFFIVHCRTGSLEKQV